MESVDSQIFFWLFRKRAQNLWVPEVHIRYSFLPRKLRECCVVFLIQG